MENKDILSVQEFASCLGIHYNTVRQMIKKGKINSFKIGTGGRTSNIKIPRSEIYRLSVVNLEHTINEIVEKRIFEKTTKTHAQFFSKIEKTDTCWLWKGALSKSGYGVFSLNEKYIRAHRASYILFKGEIPKKSLILHSCDVRNCVNPDHLSLGTNQDNSNQMKQRNRHKTCLNHPLKKLTDIQISEIRDLRKQKIKAKEIAKIYNISFEYVYQIAKGIYR